ncbi:hypothetical protein ACK9YZ_30250 [Rhizobium sp. ZK1]|uniref:hypothetical protein n=1 Tax=Rhizobium sp. ZK1 TaxID=3389872 RepID=UPI0039F6B971
MPALPYTRLGHDAESSDTLFSPKATLLIDQLRLGVRRPEIRPSVRMLVEAPFVMLYETIPDADEGPIETVVIVAWWMAGEICQASFLRRKIIFGSRLRYA